MGLKFDPPRQVSRFALFVDRGETYGSSRFTFKATDTLGVAKLKWHANGKRFDSKIVENVDGEWYTLYDIPKGTVNPPWQQEKEAPGWRGNYKVYRAIPMSREDYADWRVKVERERIQEKYDLVLP